jgi:hypothetical protein
MKQYYSKDYWFENSFFEVDKERRVKYDKGH